jgi:hypothetical protein
VGGALFGGPEFVDKYGGVHGVAIVERDLGGETDGALVELFERGEFVPKRKGSSGVGTERQQLKLFPHDEGLINGRTKASKRAEKLRVFPPCGGANDMLGFF